VEHRCGLDESEGLAVISSGKWAFNLEFVSAANLIYILVFLCIIFPLAKKEIYILYLYAGCCTNS
jgi:hypothetical protein